MAARNLVLLFLLLVVLPSCTPSDSNPGDISLSGVIEAQEVILRAPVSGRVVRLAVEQGGKVGRDELVAEIDHEKLEIRKAEIEADLRLARIRRHKAEREQERVRRVVQSRLREAEANLSYARSLHARARAGERQEERRRGAEAVRGAEAALKEAKDALKRAQRLFAEGIVARERLDSAQARYDRALARTRGLQNRLRMLMAGTRKEDIAAARAREEAARAEFESARADLSLIALRQEDVALARARVEKISRQLELIEARIRDTYVRSPIQATVAEKFVEVGESVTEGMPLVSVTDLGKVWLWVYVPEADLARIKVGDGARVVVDSYPDKPFPGRVVFVRKEAEFTPKNIQTREDRLTLVFGVKVEVDNPDELLKPGLPADAVLRRR